MPPERLTLIVLEARHDFGDEQLARQVRGGSAAAFDELVRRHHGRVFGFLLTLTRHRQDAEDLTQETFLRAWDKFHHYNPELPLLPWLFTIARRQSIGALRKLRRPPAEWPEPAGPEPEAAADHPALRLWELAKRELKPDAYQALWLHYREELPLKQIAGILGKREGAVKVLLHRARKALAARLADREAAGDPALPLPPLADHPHPQTFT